MRATALFTVLAFLLSVAAGPRAEEPSKETLPKEVLIIDLGTEPTGDAVDLPAWAFGNLTIRSFNPSRPSLEVTVNILPQLLVEQPATYSIVPGQLVTVSLKSGLKLVFYFKVKPVKIEEKVEKEDGGFTTRSVDGYNVTLVVRKMPTASP